MRDVARHAGVSPKTVSNVMNGYPYIREETRIKVLASIDALGYQMNISARNLKSGRTGIIAFEGDSQAKMYLGNWSDYETAMKEKFGKDLTPHRVKYRVLKR